MILWWEQLITLYLYVDVHMHPFAYILVMHDFIIPLAKGI